MEDWDENTHSRPHGEDFAALIETAAHGVEGVSVRRQSCLMGCKAACNIAIQDAEKLSYVLGRFEPGGESAQAVVDYAKLHAESETGQVPFKTWPQGVKGHFRARLPKT